MERHRNPRPARGARAVRTLGKLLASSLIAAAALVATTGALPALLGYRTMIVTSGSMAPAINPGDAVVLDRASAASIRAGDIITFHPLGGTRLTTHRVLGIRHVDERIHFQTKGDANDTPDANLAPADAVEGKVAIRLPGIGFLLSFAVTRAGRLLLIVLPAAAIAIQQARALKRGLGSPGIAAVAALAIVALGVPAGTPATGAVFTDQVSLADNTLSTATLQPPTLPTALAACDGAAAAKVTLNWAATTSAFADGYDVLRASTAGGPYAAIAHVTGRTTTSHTDTGLALGVTRFYVIQSTASNWTSGNSLEVQAATPLICV